MNIACNDDDLPNSLEGSIVPNPSLDFPSALHASVIKSKLLLYWHEDNGQMLDISAIIGTQDNQCIGILSWRGQSQS